MRESYRVPTGNSGEIPTGKETNVQEHMVRRDHGAQLPLLGVCGVDNEHPSVEDRPVREAAHAEHRRDTGVSVPQGDAVAESRSGSIQVGDSKRVEGD